jgi:hypothetical protein
MKASTPDELIVGFPHSILLKVTCKLIFEYIKIMNLNLNTNSMIISSMKVVDWMATSVLS